MIAVNTQAESRPSWEHRFWRQLARVPVQHLLLPMWVTETSYSDCASVFPSVKWGSSRHGWEVIEDNCVKNALYTVNQGQSGSAINPHG